MRLWSLHPKYLDARGLVALWREALLAQQVLRGRTRGYRHHPQLQRFRAAPDAVAAIGAYLSAILDEAHARGYCFDAARIHRRETLSGLLVTRDQLDYELQHLRRKLWQRDRAAHRQLRSVTRVVAHPMFSVRPGPIAPWEIIR